MKQQIVVTHVIRQTDTLALPDSWVRNIPSVTIFCPQKLFSLYLLKNTTSLSFDKTHPIVLRNDKSIHSVKAQHSILIITTINLLFSVDY